MKQQEINTRQLRDFLTEVRAKQGLFVDRTRFIGELALSFYGEDTGKLLDFAISRGWVSEKAGNIFIHIKFKEAI